MPMAKIGSLHTQDLGIAQDKPLIFAYQCKNEYLFASYFGGHQIFMGTRVLIHSHLMIYGMTPAPSQLHEMLFPLVE